MRININGSSKTIDIFTTTLVIAIAALKFDEFV